MSTEILPEQYKADTMARLGIALSIVADVITRTYAIQSVNQETESFKESLRKICRDLSILIKQFY